MRVRWAVVVDHAELTPTLAQDNGPALVGRVIWTDVIHMSFRIVGACPDDPVLSFSK